MKVMFDNNWYSADSGKFMDPSTDQRFTLKQSLGNQLVDETSVVINEPHSGEVYNLREALANGTVNGKTGRVKDELSGGETLPL